MVQNRYPSPIIVISDEDTRTDSSTESDSDTRTDSSTEADSSWWGPENQLGLQPGEQFGSRRDDEDDDEVALDKKGEIKYYEAIAKY